MNVFVMVDDGVVSSQQEKITRSRFGGLRTGRNKNSINQATHLPIYRSKNLKSHNSKNKERADHTSLDKTRVTLPYHESSKWRLLSPDCFRNLPEPKRTPDTERAIIFYPMQIVPYGKIIAKTFPKRTMQKHRQAPATANVHHTRRCHVEVKSTNMGDWLAGE